MTGRSGRFRMTRGNNIKPTIIDRLVNKRSAGSNWKIAGKMTMLLNAVAISVL
jgi:hypothetical protein